MAGSLSERLKSLGVQLGASGLQPPKKAGFPIEDVVEGDLEPTPQGDVFVVNKTYPSGYLHGSTALDPCFEFPILSRWARAGSEDYSPGDILFLDTETTGLAGGAGTLVFMVGLGYFSSDRFNITQLFLKTPADVAAFLSKLQNISNPHKAICTYNGKTFDAPLLNSQCIINRMAPFLKEKAHYDLLPLARRLWSNRLPSRTLKDIEAEILGVRRTSEEIPGWMIPEIYADYLRSGDSRPLQGVFYHNEVDILSLAALFTHSSRLLSEPTTRPDHSLVDVYSIARLYDDLGEVDRARELFEHCLNGNIDGGFLPRVINHLALHHRRRGEWEEAVDLWLRGAELEDAFSCIELAKYYEHVAADFSTALCWTVRARNLRDPAILAPGEESIQHRQRRLERKLSAQMENEVKNMESEK